MMAFSTDLFVISHCRVLWGNKKYHFTNQKVDCYGNFALNWWKYQDKYVPHWYYVSEYCTVQLSWYVQVCEWWMKIIYRA
jgi:hypothetical protein